MGKKIGRRQRNHLLYSLNNRIHIWLVSSPSFPHACYCNFILKYNRNYSEEWMDEEIWPFQRMIRRHAEFRRWSEFPVKKSFIFSISSMVQDLIPENIVDQCGKGAIWVIFRFCANLPDCEWMGLVKIRRALQLAVIYRSPSLSVLKNSTSLRVRR